MCRGFKVDALIDGTPILMRSVIRVEDKIPHQRWLPVIAAEDVPAFFEKRYGELGQGFPGAASFFTHVCWGQWRQALDMRGRGAGGPACRCHSHLHRSTPRLLSCPCLTLQLYHHVPTQMALGPAGEERVVFGAEGFTKEAVQAYCSECPVRANTAPRKPTEVPIFTPIVAVAILVHQQV